MEDNNDNNGEGRYQTQYNQPWFERYSLVILGWMHNLPKHLEQLLPKFDPKTFALPEDHIKKFILAIRLMNVQQKYVMCRIFPYTSENSSSTWYFNLQVGSIASWTKF